MSNFDRMIEKQQNQTQQRQELKKALKQVDYLVQLSLRTGKAKQAKKVKIFLRMQNLCQWSPGTFWSQLWALRQNHETGDLKGSRASRYLVISALVGFEIKWTCQGPKASSQLFCHRH